jgi:hypothetical protein
MIGTTILDFFVCRECELVKHNMERCIPTEEEKESIKKLGSFATTRMLCKECHRNIGLEKLGI